MRILARILGCSLISTCLCAFGCGTGSAAPSTPQIAVAFGAKGNLVNQTGRGSARLELAGPLRGAGSVFVSGTPYMVVQLDTEMPETLVYAPTGVWVYDLPAEDAAKSCIWRVLPPNAFKGDKHVMTARAATREEIAAYRNLALNPYDVRGQASAYPHATSNSECRGEADFAARNAIDGNAKNTSHGPWPVQSWGPDQRTDLWWQVDFGRTVEVDKVVIYIRADFPHDAFWHTATLEFSDGSRVDISLKKQAAPQEFKFPARKTTCVKLANLVQTQPLGWAAITEVEVWGRNTVDARTK